MTPATVDPRLVSIGRIDTVANVVTLVRTVAAMVLGVLALVQQDAVLLGVAYVVYWLGDMADGFAARQLDQETRFGAVFDVISDRACASVLGLGLISLLPDTAWALVPFLVSFMVLDTMLTLAFLCWPLVSPNHFDQVDPLVHRLNWSVPVKMLNTSAVVLLAIAGLIWLSLLLTLVMIGIKIWSGLRVLRLLESR